MKRAKFLCPVLILMVTLLEPFPSHAEPEQEPAPAQVEAGGIDPLASVLTAMNMPARAVLCGLTGWMASIVMTVSGGMRYADAAQMMEEGCSGPWVITPEMLEGSREKEKERATDTLGHLGKP